MGEEEARPLHVAGALLDEDLVELLPIQVANTLTTRVSPVWVDVESLPDRGELGVSDELLQELTRYLNAARSENTLRAYASDWRIWSRWCDQVGLSPLPATPLTLATYLAAAASALRPAEVAENRGEPPQWRYATSTLERHAAAVVAVHAAHNQASPRDALVRQTLTGIRKYRRSPQRRARALELGDVRKMLNARPTPGWPGSPARRRDRCLLLFGFAGALRRSEASALDLTEVAYHPEDGLHVTIGYSKTDQEGHGDVIALPFGSRPLTCPVCAYLSWAELLQHHHRGGSELVRAFVENVADTEIAAEKKHLNHDQAAAALGLMRGPLFPPITRHGHIGTMAMSGDAIHDLVRRYAGRAGIPDARVSGHSLRAGFATTAGRSGSSNREIMRQGRWKSHATVDKYVRIADPLADNAVTKLGL